MRGVAQAAGPASMGNGLPALSGRNAPLGKPGSAQRGAAATASRGVTHVPIGGPASLPAAPADNPGVFKSFYFRIISMGTKKAFVFSLDSFVAFVLTVAALYSLLFFATVPAAYYSSLTQANYLAKDTLLALATTTAGETSAHCSEGQTYLDCVIENEKAARVYIGSKGPEGEYDESALVPAQFGYKIETLDFSEGNGEINFSDADWKEAYNTADDLPSANKKEYHKLKAAAHALYFGYSEAPEGGEGSPLHYVSCGGEYTICSWPEPFIYYGSYDHDGNTDIVGDAYSRVVRLTVYT